MKDLEDYQDLYVKTDVLLLCNVFETFRTIFLEHYTLNRAHFFISPGLAWQVCLKKTEFISELLTDHNMLLMLSEVLKGGITQAAHRYVQVNNMYMGNRFDPGKESHYIQYLDANNLYGCPMV